jgi:5-methyltetrahydropteroyltriglutamate--homocysteine methyltransferase
MSRKIVDTILPVTMVGSYPRPLWYRYQLHGAHLLDAFKVEELRYAYEDATLAAIDDQERAGLDIVTDGQVYFDDYGAAIGSFIWYWYERIPGFETLKRHSPLNIQREDGDESEIATLENTGGTIVTSKVRAPEGGTGHVEMFQIARAHAHRPVKYSVGAGPGNIGFHVDYNHPRSAYKSPRELAEDLVPIFNQLLKDLVAAGCEFIQVEDLSIWMMLEGKQNRWVIDVMKAWVEGVDAKIAWHTCLGTAYGNTLKAFEGKTNQILEYMYEVDVDQYVLDFAVRDMQDVHALKSLPKDKEIAVGVIDVRTLQIESTEEVVERMHKVLEIVPPERVYFTTDCGMKALHRFVAQQKLASLARAARQVRSELPATAAAQPDLAQV